MSHMSNHFMQTITDMPYPVIEELAKFPYDEDGNQYAEDFLRKRWDDIRDEAAREYRHELDRYDNRADWRKDLKNPERYLFVTVMLDVMETFLLEAIEGDLLEA